MRHRQANEHGGMGKFSLFSEKLSSVGFEGTRDFRGRDSCANSAATSSESFDSCKGTIRAPPSVDTSPRDSPASGTSMALQGSEEEEEGSSKTGTSRASCTPLTECGTPSPQLLRSTTAAAFSPTSSGGHAAQEEGDDDEEEEVVKRKKRRELEQVSSLEELHQVSTEADLDKCQAYTQGLLRATRETEAITEAFRAYLAGHIAQERERARSLRAHSQSTLAAITAPPPSEAQRPPSSPSAGTAASAGDGAPAGGEAAEATSSPGSSTPISTPVLPPPSSMPGTVGSSCASGRHLLRSLAAADDEQAATVEKLCNRMEESAMLKVEMLQAEVRRISRAVKERGCGIMDILHSVNADVERRFQNAVATFSRTVDRMEGRRGSTSTLTAAALSNCQWLATFQYHGAVRQQQSLFQSMLLRLQALFTKVRSMIRLSRLEVKQAVNSFMACRQAAWVGEVGQERRDMPEGISSAISTALDGMATKVEGIQIELKDIITRVTMANNAAAAAAAAGGRGGGGGSDAHRDDPDLPPRRWRVRRTQSAPSVVVGTPSVHAAADTCREQALSRFARQSPLAVRIGRMQRKKSVGRSGTGEDDVWVEAVGVLTIDSFLHVFDLPEEEEEEEEQEREEKEEEDKKDKKEEEEEEEEEEAASKSSSSREALLKALFTGASMDTNLLCCDGTDSDRDVMRLVTPTLTFEMAESRTVMVGKQSMEGEGPLPLPSPPAVVAPAAAAGAGAGAAVVETALGGAPCSSPSISDAVEFRLRGFVKHRGTKALFRTEGRREAVFRTDDDGQAEEWVEDCGRMASAAKERAVALQQQLHSMRK